MNRKPSLIALVITLVMAAYWIGVSSSQLVPASAMLSKGTPQDKAPGTFQPDAGEAGQVLLYEPALSANIKTVLDDFGDVGTYTSITIGADGLPLISYRDTTTNRLKVSHCNDIACTDATRTISTSNAQHTSIMLGSDGLGVIGLYDPVSRHLRVAHCENVLCTSMLVNSVDQSADVGQYNSITIGADGFPIISYYDVTNQNLRLADCDNLTCTNHTLRVLDSTGDVGQYSSIVRGALGFPIISYYDATNTHLKVLACADADCSQVLHRTTVDTSDISGLQTSIALGADDNPIISYVVGVGNSSKLRIGHCADPFCFSLDVKITHNVPGSGINSSVAIGLDGLPMISHHNQALNTLNVLRCRSIDCSEGSYSIELDSILVGSNTSMTIGVDGMPIISYHHLRFEALMTLHCGSPSCKEFQRRR